MQIVGDAGTFWIFWLGMLNLYFFLYWDQFWLYWEPGDHQTFLGLSCINSRFPSLLFSPRQWKATWGQKEVIYKLRLLSTRATICWLENSRPPDQAHKPCGTNADLRWSFHGNSLHSPNHWQPIPSLALLAVATQSKMNLIPQNSSETMWRQPLSPPGSRAQFPQKFIHQGQLPPPGPGC